MPWLDLFKDSWGSWAAVDLALRSCFGGGAGVR
jgi:hypothetical protein